MGDGLTSFNSAKVSLHKKSNTLIYNSGLQSLNSASPIPTGLKALSLSSYHKTTASSPKKAMKPALSKKSLQSIEVFNPQPNQSFTLQKKLTQLLQPKRHKKTQSDQIPKKFQHSMAAHVLLPSSPRVLSKQDKDRNNNFHTRSKAMESSGKLS